MSVYFNPTDDDSKFPATLEDQQGNVGTALVGNTQWSLNTYRDTGLIVPFLRRDQSDFVNLILQFSHRRQPNTSCIVHAHLIPMAASDGNVFWSWSWFWATTHDTMVIPAIVGWTLGNTTIPLLGVDQYKLGQYLITIATPAPDLTENTSSILFMKLSRLGTNINDTYQGNAGAGVNAENLAVVYIDAHFTVDRQGGPA